MAANNEVVTFGDLSDMGIGGTSFGKILLSKHYHKEFPEGATIVKEEIARVKSSRPIKCIANIIQEENVGHLVHNKNVSYDFYRSFTDYNTFWKLTGHGDGNDGELVPVFKIILPIQLTDTSKYTVITSAYGSQQNRSSKILYNYINGEYIFIVDSYIESNGYKHSLEYTLFITEM